MWEIASQRGNKFLQLLLPKLPALLAAGCFLLCVDCIALNHGVKDRLYEPQGSPQFSSRAVEIDIRKVIDEHPHARFQMGYSDGQHYNMTFLRPVLQFRGSPLFIDADVRNEASLIGKPISPSVLAALRNCTIDLWFIPKGGAPFSMDSPYFVIGKIRERALYSQVFVDTFLSSYEEVPSDSRYFNIWACRSLKPASINIPAHGRSNPTAETGGTSHRH
jgi:hypothetical protein